MDYRYAKSVIAKLSAQIKWLIVGISGLLLANILLVLLLWHQSGRHNTILIPANLHDSAQITDHSISSTYLEAMALMLVNDRLNITPKTIRGSSQNLLRFVDPKYYAVFEQKLNVDASEVTSAKVSSVFYVNQVHTDPKVLTVVIGGQLQRWVGERSIGISKKSYQLSFSRKGDVVLLTAFQEIKQPE